MKVSRAISFLCLFISLDQIHGFRKRRMSTVMQQIEVPGCRCFHIYRPVCGEDGHTYGNHCEAQCQGIKMATRGRCEDQEKPSSRAAFFAGDEESEVDVNKPCPCPFIFRPVCGSDGRTYPNECSATCRQVAVKSEGRCPRKEQMSHGRRCMCPRIRRPVCGEDGVTYGNACLARCKQVAIAFREPCVEPEVTEEGENDPAEEGAELLCPCPAMLRPVCGADGRTYSNPCVATCNGHEFTEGRCETEE